MARFTSFPNIQPSRLRDGRPVTAAWCPGSMKSGPALNACTTRPLAANAAKRASMIVVLPTLLAVPAITRRGAFTIEPHNVSRTRP